MKKLCLLFIVPLITFSQTIQEQLDNAVEGATLNIASGIYYESISVEKSITLICVDNCIIDASGFSGGISITASNVIIDGFEIIGDENTTYGVVINPVCSNISITNNTIHGMSLPNAGNTSPLSYGILAYGNSAVEAPTNLNFSNNNIFDVAGSGISLGSFTGNVDIENNTISDLNTVNLLGEEFNVGIQAQAAEYVSIVNNNFINLMLGSNLIFTSGELQNNNYENTIAFLSHTTLASVIFEDQVDWWSVDGTVEYLSVNFDITSYFNSLENAVTVASQNESNILGSNGIIYDFTGNIISTNIIETSATHKFLLKTTNILGKETNNNKDLQLHIYDDGSVGKKYLIK